MLKMTRSRRRWNNLLMLGVLAFMLLLNLPTLIKTYLIDTPVDREHPHLLNPNWQLQALHSAKWSLVHENNHWFLNVPSAVSAQELAQRWKDLVGTPVDEDNYRSLKPRLINLNSLEVWYRDQEEPQRITYYQLPQFWLLKNWQEQWIAVSVEANYLLPMDITATEK